MAKFLIIRFSSIGNIVLSTPVIRCLRNKFPDSQIHNLTKNAFKGILTGNSNIDKIHTTGDSFRSMLHELKEEKFDYIIDLYHNLRTFLVKQFLWRSTSFSFNKLNIEKYIYTNFKI